MIDDSFAARSPNIAVVISFAAGFCVWAGLSLFAGVREAWDTPASWLVGLPLLVVVSAALGYVVPVRVWRWPVFVGLGQILGMIVLNPGAGWGLLPLMFVFVMVPLVVILTIPALFGGVIARGRWDAKLLA